MDQVLEAVRIAALGRRGSYVDLWVWNETEDAFFRRDAEWKLLNPDLLVVHVGERSFLVKLTEIVDDAPDGPAAPAIEGQLELSAVLP